MAVSIGVGSGCEDEPLGPVGDAPLSGSAVGGAQQLRVGRQATHRTPAEPLGPEHAQALVASWLVQ